MMPAWIKHNNGFVPCQATSAVCALRPSGHNHVAKDEFRPSLSRGCYATMEAMSGKRSFEIWLRDGTGKEEESTWDSKWPTAELAEREIARRDLPLGKEYFVKPSALPEATGLMKRGGPSHKTAFGDRRPSPKRSHKG